MCSHIGHFDKIHLNGPAAPMNTLRKPPAKKRAVAPPRSLHTDALAGPEVKTLGKALQVLEAVAQMPHPPTISELALSVGISRPTAHRLVQTLAAMGFLQQIPNETRWSIGFSVLPLAA